MKTSQNQKEVIKVVKNLLSYWENSNDLDSPTVQSDIDEELSLLDLSAQQLDELSYKVSQLLSEIRNID